MPFKNKSSIWYKKEFGDFWQSNLIYSNHLPPYDEKNKEISEFLLNKLDFSKSYKQGLSNSILLQLANCCIVYNINESEIFEKFEANETRIKYLQKVEMNLRIILKKIGMEETIDNAI